MVDLLFLELGVQLAVRAIYDTLERIVADERQLPAQGLVEFTEVW